MFKPSEDLIKRWIMVKALISSMMDTDSEKVKQAAVTDLVLRVKDLVSLYIHESNEAENLPDDCKQIFQLIEIIAPLMQFEK